MKVYVYMTMTMTMTIKYREYNKRNINL